MPGRFALKRRRRGGGEGAGAHPFGSYPRRSGRYPGTNLKMKTFYLIILFAYLFIYFIQLFIYFFIYF